MPLFNEDSTDRAVAELREITYSFRMIKERGRHYTGCNCSVCKTLELLEHGAPAPSKRDIMPWEEV